MHVSHRNTLFILYQLGSVTLSVWTQDCGANVSPLEEGGEGRLEGKVAGRAAGG